jgi:hypothetical protein
MTTTLARRQRWLYGAITAGRVPARPGLHLGGAAVPAEIGLAVYRHAYRARLREALADDFTAVARVMGEDAFARLVDCFIRAHPPQDATLNAYGRFFAPWLARTRIRGRTALAELARLEWALIEALHAPLAAGLDGTALAGVASDRWGAVRLRPAPSLRVLPCRFSVNSTYEAVRRDLPPPALRRESGGVAVIRHVGGLRRTDLAHLETRVLLALINGATLATALSHLPADDLPAIHHASARWIAQGFFTALV